MLMKVAFIADDGTVFESAAECVEYDKKHPLIEEDKPILYKMWDEHFAPTNDLEGSQYVYLPNVNAVEQFIHYSEECDLETFGIDNSGLYKWNVSEYEQIDLSYYRSIIRMIDEMEEV